MRDLSHRQRLAATGALCSGVVALAGIVALQGGVGIVVASVLLTTAIVIGLIGSGLASDSRLGVGIALLIAAGLPLFLGLYLIGANIFRRLGAGVAGGLLIGIGVGIAVGSGLMWLSARQRPAPHRR